MPAEISKEASNEKCLCEKARESLEDTIKDPFNYHPEYGDAFDYGSKSLRDVGDAVRYYEDAKARCPCRKRDSEWTYTTINFNSKSIAAKKPRNEND